MPGNRTLVLRLARGFDSEYCIGSSGLVSGVGVGIVVRRPDWAGKLTVQIVKTRTTLQNVLIQKAPLGNMT